MATRIVTGTVLMADLVAYPNSPITFELENDFTDLGVTYLSSVIEVMPNATTGYFTVTLAVPTTPATAIYRVRLVSGIEQWIYLTSGPATDLATLLTLAGSPIAQSALQTVIDAHELDLNGHTDLNSLNMIGNITSSAGKVVMGSVANANIARFHATEAIGVHAHYGFLDTSVVDYVGVATQGHASFIDAITIQGIQDSSHHNSFQAQTTYNGSGTLTGLRSYYSLPIVNAPGGTITELIHFAAYNPTWTAGTITTQYGLVIGSLTSGVTNWAIYTAGITPSHFGGAVTIIGAASVQGLTIGMGPGAINTNTAFGLSALLGNTTGAENTAMGSGALMATITDHANTAVGYLALTASNGSSGNDAFGSWALKSLTSPASGHNSAFGCHALENLTTGNNNAAFGYSTLNGNIIGENNVAVGSLALTLNTGSDNMAIGANALASNTTGFNNTAIGSAAMVANDTGADNTAIGYYSLSAQTAANFNTAIGYYAGKKQTASGITAVGCLALANSVGGSGCVAVGNSALAAQTSGNNNTAIGYEALKSMTTTSNGTALGSAAGYTNNADGGVYVGFAAGYYETGANKLFIDNATRASEADGRTKALIYGIFDAAVANQELTFNAGKMGFFGHVAAAQPTKAGHANWAALANVVQALVDIGIFDAA